MSDLQLTNSGEPAKRKRTRRVSVPRNLALVQVHAVAYLQAVAQGGAERLRQEEQYAAQAEVVFAYWAARLGHPGSILDPKREKRILARLRETGGNWGELCYAVDGALKDDWLMGRAVGSPRRYDGIETVFRDREQVERLAESCHNYRAGKPHPLVVKYEAGTNGAA